MKDSGYVKRTQKDYSMSFKLAVVEEVEKGHLTYKQAQQKYGIQGKSTILEWLRKYGNFDWENQTPHSMSKTPEQKLLELEHKVRLLEKKNKRLAHQVERADKKAIIFDMMIDLAEKEYNISIRKNSSPEQSTNTKDNTKKA
jgi:transposase